MGSNEFVRVRCDNCDLIYKVASVTHGRSYICPRCLMSGTYISLGPSTTDVGYDGYLKKEGI